MSEQDKKDKVAESTDKENEQDTESTEKIDTNEDDALADTDKNEQNEQKEGQERLLSDFLLDSDLTVKQGMDSIPKQLPVLAVRDVVVFNYMILPLFIGREKSVNAVEAALQKDRHLFVTTQKDEATEDPSPDDLYETGSIVHVMRMLKMPDGRIKVLVQGVMRAKIDKYTQTEPYMIADLTQLVESEAEEGIEIEALLRSAREQSEKILTLRGINTSEISGILQNVEEPGRLADLIAANLRLKNDDAQNILETIDPVKRLELVNSHLLKEVEVA